MGIEHRDDGIDSDANPDKLALAEGSYIVIGDGLRVGRAWVENLKHEHAMAMEVVEAAKAYRECRRGMRTTGGQSARLQHDTRIALDDALARFEASDGD